MRHKGRAAASVSTNRSGRGCRRAPSIPMRASTAARRLLVALAAAVALPEEAPALEFQTARTPSGRLVIRAEGSIRPGDAEKFRAVLLAAGAGDRTPHLLINSGGGSVGAAVQMATTINQARIPVVAGDVCASACFFVLAASPYATVGPLSRIGVHRAYQKGVGETEASREVTANLTRIAQSLAVPSAVVLRILNTPGNERTIYWLTEDDLRSMRLRFALPADAQQAVVPTVDAAIVAAAPAEGGAATAEAGKRDRLAYRRWLSGLADRGREGAVFSMRPRRLSSWAGCLSASWAFSSACYTARRLLAEADERGRDPNYRRGWEGP
jgi:hypothetical protein